jgi:hypothetical protein
MRTTPGFLTWKTPEITIDGPMLESDSYLGWVTHSGTIMGIQSLETLGRPSLDLSGYTV